MLLKLLKNIIRKEELFFSETLLMMIFFYWTSTVVCEYACTRVITLVSSIYHVSLYLIKENPYYNWYPVIVLWNHLGWLSRIILAHKSTSLRIYIQAFVKCLLELYRYCYQQNCVPTNQENFSAQWFHSILWRLMCYVSCKYK